jgi:outer membrane protein OmpA-like peptidoglycan-associated protein
MLVERNHFFRSVSCNMQIETDGKGETEPITANNSMENNAKNRKVKFIKR